MIFRSKSKFFGLALKVLLKRDGGLWWLICGDLISMWFVFIIFLPVIPAVGKMLIWLKSASIMILTLRLLFSSSTVLFPPKIIATKSWPVIFKYKRSDVRFTDRRGP